MKSETQAILRRILKDIQVEMSDEFDQNFEREAFFSEAWQRRRSPMRPDGHILVDTGQLRRSIQSRTTENSITFYTDLPYAAIHNEGGEIVVTPRMKKYFRAKAMEAAGIFGRKKKRNPRGETSRHSAPLTDRQFWGWMHTASLDSVAEFWCAMAMMKVGSSVKIPRRHFLGTSPEVEQAVRTIIEENLSGYIEEAINFEIKER